MTEELVGPQIEAAPGETTTTIGQTVISGPPTGAVIETAGIIAEMDEFVIDAMLTRIEISFDVTAPGTQDRTRLGTIGNRQAPVLQRGLRST